MNIFGKKICLWMVRKWLAMFVLKTKCEYADVTCWNPKSYGGIFCKEVKVRMKTAFYKNLKMLSDKI